MTHETILDAVTRAIGEVRTYPSGSDVSIAGLKRDATGADMAAHIANVVHATVVAPLENQIAELKAFHTKAVEFILRPNPLSQRAAALDDLVIAKNTRIAELEARVAVPEVITPPGYQVEIIRDPFSRQIIQIRVSKGDNQ